MVKKPYKNKEKMDLEVPRKWTFLCKRLRLPAPVPVCLPQVQIRLPQLPDIPVPDPECYHGMCSFNMVLPELRLPAALIRM